MPSYVVACGGSGLPEHERRGPEPELLWQQLHELSQWSGKLDAHLRQQHLRLQLQRDLSPVLEPLREQLERGQLRLELFAMSCACE